MIPEAHRVPVHLERAQIQPVSINHGAKSRRLVVGREVEKPAAAAVVLEFSQ